MAKLFFKKIKKKKNIYGRELILDLNDCDSGIIRSKEKILEYSDRLCNLIRMKKFREPIIERFGFGEDYAAGFSLVQLIETSSVTAHFSEMWNSAHINIFSCKPFNHKIAKEFSQKFFKAKKVKNRFIIR